MRAYSTQNSRRSGCLHRGVARGHHRQMRRAASIRPHGTGAISRGVSFDRRALDNRLGIGGIVGLVGPKAKIAGDVMADIAGPGAWRRSLGWLRQQAQRRQRMAQPQSGQDRKD